MHNRARRGWQAVVLVVVTALVAGIVVAAVQAHGRADVRTSTNDGGAWLIRRDRGLAGHMNRSVGEVTGAVRVAKPGALFDIEQSAGVLAADDGSSNTVSIIDPRTFQVSNPIAVPPDTRLIATDAGAVLWTPAPLQVWRLDTAELADATDLGTITPLVTGKAAGMVTANADGTTWIVDVAAATATRFGTDGAIGHAVVLGDLAAAATAVTMVGSDLVVVAGTSSAVVDASGEIRPLGGVADGTVPAQPSPAGSPVVLVAQDGTILSAAATGDAAAVIGSAGGGGPVAPIVHEGCIYAVVANPPTLTRTCNGVTDQTTSLDGVTGTSLRLRLVNGWIWVNDLDTGATWITSNQSAVDKVDDWGSDLSSSGGAGSDDAQSGGTGQQQDNPDSDDAIFKRADQIDDDGVNEPPVARDDTAATRADQPVIVHVLRNDEDPDGDVMLVSALSDLPADAAITPTADRATVQVSPPPGFTGTLAFTYTITDGRGGEATAKVAVAVAPNDGSNNRPPVTATDVAEAQAGAPAAVNVLANDSDPDGDTLVLESASAASGTVVFDPGGQVSFTPDPGTPAGTVEVQYTAADAFGAETPGLLRVQIRLTGSNNEPDARNDSAVTVTGKPVTLDALANDTDPDGDPLSIAAAPVLVAPTGVDPTTYTVSLSEDGQFFFVAAQPGQYLFRYSIIDGSEGDTATIRVDVEPAADNRPPIAVRDDITIGRGGTRTVYVLQNDADPDGDVVALTGFTAAAGIDVDEVAGVGLRVTVHPDAPNRVEFRYTISDGRSDPVDGTVMVSVSNAASVDQAPVAKPDIVEVRPGRTATVPVLLNDYDPEGEAIHVGNVATAPSATARIGPGGQEVYVTVAPTATTGFSFAYDVVDSAGNRSGSFVQVRLVPDGQANRPPVARADVARTRSGSTIGVAVLGNDSDPDGDPIRIDSIAAQPAFGQAAINADDTITYTSVAGFTGTDRFRYVLIDAKGDRSIGDVLVGVLPVNSGNTPPTASDDSYTVLAGSDTIALDVLTNDSDVDGDQLRVSAAQGNTSGTSVVVIDDKRTHVLFTAPAAITGDTQRFTIGYTIEDGHGGTDEAVATVDVVASRTPVAPVAVDDIVGPVRPGTVVTIDVLANDIDPDGSRSKLTPSTADPALVFGADNIATLTAGTESGDHPYTITDADGLTSTANVTVIVSNNLAPTATPIVVQTPADQPITIDIGASVADPDGDIVFFACCDNPLHGSAVTATSAANVLTVTFTPDAAYAGPAGFAYRADDQHGHIVSGSVAIEVLAPTDRPPVATDGTATVEAGTTGSISLAPFASDPDVPLGDTLTFALGAPPAGVTLDGSTVTVVAPLNAGGTTVAIPFQVTDSAGQSASATITVAITAASAPPPVAVADRVRIAQGARASVAVLANDIDPLGQGLRVVSAGAVDGSAAVHVEADGTVTVQPAGEFFGTLHVSYTIRDARDSDAGQATGEITVDVVGLPGAPPTPQASATSHTATVTWGQAAANGSPIDDIQIGTNANDGRSIGPVNSYVFAGLPNGVGQVFRVRAHNEAGWGPWSGFSSPVTPDAEPGRPAAPAVAFGDRSLAVTWSTPPNDGSAITGYQLEIGGGINKVQQLGSVTAFNWTGLTNGVNYQFRVVAVNAAGRSEASAWSTAEHPLREPAAPGPPNVVQGDRYLDLTWAKPDDNGDPVVEYQVQMIDNAAATASTTITTFRWSNLPNGVAHQFHVRARNRDADGVWSAASVAVKPCGLPDTPAGPTATRGDGDAAVAWNAPGDQGCAITGYEVRTSTGSHASPGTTTTFTGLSNGTAYSFSVRAKNSVGWGAWSAGSAPVTPAGLPQGPTSITAKVAGVGTVDLDWPAAKANGSAIGRYELSVNNGAAKSVGNVISYRYAGLGNGTAYSFKVRACNDVGCGPWSAGDSATTWGEPDQVGTPAVSPGNATLDASWSAPAANGKAIDHYEADIDPGGSKNVDGRSTTWNGLDNGTTYRVRVRACNAVGCGSWSGWASAKPVSPIDISISKGASAQGQPGCGSQYCRYIVIRATGLSPNTTYNRTCNDASGAYSTYTLRTDSSGNGTDNTTCYYGYPGQQTWVVVGGHRSNTITW